MLTTTRFQRHVTASEGCLLHVQTLKLNYSGRDLKAWHYREM